MTTTIARNPSSGVYAATPDYVHAMEVRDHSRLLFVSGTMGLDERGEPGEDIDRQLELVWSNLRAILASAGMSMDNVVRVTSYLRDAAFAEMNQNARVAALGGRVVPCTTIVAQTLTPGWLVEVELIAAA